MGKKERKKKTLLNICRRKKRIRKKGRKVSIENKNENENASVTKTKILSSNFLATVSLENE